MDESYSKELIVHDPKFFSDAFRSVLSFNLEQDICKLFDLSTEAEISFWMDETELQDSFAFRSKRRAVLVAEYLIGAKGEIQPTRVASLFSLLEERGHIPYPDGFCDGVITEHLLLVVKKLHYDKKITSMIQKFQSPLCHTWAEDLVRESLSIDGVEPLTDRIIRVAVLSACLTLLRQNVGSCFATAPAILIQSEQIEYLLQDLYDLLSTGKIKRTFGGVESSAPLSPSSGSGDLYRSMDSAEGVLRSPGLLAAWRAAGIVEPNPMVESCMTAFFERGETLRITELIHQVLLMHFGLKKEDLLSHAKMQKTLVTQKNMLGSMGDRASFKKMQICDEMLGKEKKAKAAFKSLTQHALLKAWEFTVASFAEGKMEFSRWNLYSSLGLDHQEKGGIGDVLYRTLQLKLEDNNAMVEEYQAEYSLAFDQLRATEVLLQQASTESSIHRLKTEFNTRLYHMQVCQNRRDECHRASTQYASLFSYLIKEYTDKFQEYFQEIYDAEMQDVRLGPYEDSPAGFRLVYKHGRSNAALWTMIYTAEEYVDALVNFFQITEMPIVTANDWDEAPKILSDLITSVIAHVRTEEFLESAIFRMAKVHGGSLSQDPLQKMHEQEKKPWAYTSGGNMTALLQLYYRQERVFTEESKWLEDENHLCSFIIDTLKGISHVEVSKGMLMTSPSHAFLLYPGWEEVQRGWQDPIFTYSWVRDHVTLPTRVFYEKMKFDFEEQTFLWEELGRQLPFALAQRLQGAVVSGTVSVQEMRNQMVEALRGVLVDKVDSFLYESLPLVSGRDWKDAVHQILEPLSSSFLGKTEEFFSDNPCVFLTAKQLRNIATGLFFLAEKKVAFSFDVHQKITSQVALLGFAPPKPFLFADTNWVNYYFGLLVNPGTLGLELWRVNKTGYGGFPMSSWKKWFDGTTSKEWSIYSRPVEYR